MLENKISFADLTNRFLEDYWRLNPVEATHAGVHRYDSFLPDWSDNAIVERQNWRYSSRAAFQKFDEAALNPSQQLDRKVALTELAAQAVEDEWQWVKRAPAFYIEEAMNGLNYLLARPDTRLTVTEREEQLLARLAAISKLLAQGQANLQSELVPPEWVEIGIVAVNGAIGFVKNLTLPSKPTSEDLRQRTLAALSEYKEFIQQLKPTGQFALGPELFERLLREQHGLNMTPAELYKLGEQTAHKVEAQLIELASDIAPGQSWQSIIDSLKTAHPTRDTLLQTYAHEAELARAFVKTQQLINIPPGEKLEIQPTAPFLRATMPLGHFDKTPPFADTDNLGILYITPIDPALPSERQNELLSAHCHTAIRAICLHETYPGHHLQLWYAKLHASPLRKQFASTLFVEGWALYCEEMMEEAGYFDTPALSLWQLKNSMWRAVRMMIDVGLHCGMLDLTAAARILTEKAGLEPNTALGEARRYTTSPTQPSSYMLGRNRIVELRRQYEKKQGHNSKLADFHERLLGYSSVSHAFIPDELDSHISS